MHSILRLGRNNSLHALLVYISCCFYIYGITKAIKMTWIAVMHEIIAITFELAISRIFISYYNKSLLFFSIQDNKPVLRIITIHTMLSHKCYIGRCKRRMWASNVKSPLSIKACFVFFFLFAQVVYDIMLKLDKHKYF